ncbi:hypothetical protein BT93_E1323 [Corymbia citriodora subsp. variegata]|nr:hypothetical protein BT93_E1323 [Corymbia citriodora subsp. variegata]
MLSFGPFILQEHRGTQEGKENGNARTERDEKQGGRSDNPHHGDEEQKRGGGGGGGKEGRSGGEGGGGGGGGGGGKGNDAARITPTTERKSERRTRTGGKGKKKRQKEEAVWKRQKKKRGRKKNSQQRRKPEGGESKRQSAAAPDSRPTTHCRAFAPVPAAAQLKGKARAGREKEVLQRRIRRRREHPRGLSRGKNGETSREEKRKTEERRNGRLPQLTRRRQPSAVLQLRRRK